jgi:hypothetical protein
MMMYDVTYARGPLDNQVIPPSTATSYKEHVPGTHSLPGTK